MKVLVLKYAHNVYLCKGMDDMTYEMLCTKAEMELGNDYQNMDIVTVCDSVEECQDFLGSKYPYENLNVGRSESEYCYDILATHSLSMDRDIRMLTKHRDAKIKDMTLCWDVDYHTINSVPLYTCKNSAEACQVLNNYSVKNKIFEISVLIRYEVGRI